MYIDKFIKLGYSFKLLVSRRHERNFYRFFFDSQME